MARSPDPAPTVHAAREAGRLYRASLGSDFEPCAVAYAAGCAVAMAGQHEEAIEVWLAALDEPSARGWPYLMNALVASATRAGRRREVAGRLEARAEALPELHLWRGHLLRLAGDLEAALPCLERAWGATEGELRFTAAAERLQVLVELGRLEEAVDRCREALDALPSHEASLRVSLGGLLTRAGRPEEALVELDALLARRPGLGVAHLNRGAALLRLGRADEAQAALRAAINLDTSTFSAAQRLLGAS